MAQAARLYLFPFPRYRQGNVRNRVKFLIPGPLKICKKSIVPYGREKVQYYVTGRDNLNGASRRSVSLFVSEISPRERSESCEIFNTPGPLKICKKSIVPYGREKVQYYVTLTSYKITANCSHSFTGKIKFLIPF